MQTSSNGKKQSGLKKIKSVCDETLIQSCISPSVWKCAFFLRTRNESSGCWHLWTRARACVCVCVCVSEHLAFPERITGAGLWEPLRALKRKHGTNIHLTNPQSSNLPDPKRPQFIAGTPENDFYSPQTRCINAERLTHFHETERPFRRWERL